MLWLTFDDLAERGLGSRVTVWRKVRCGEFPPPRQLGKRDVKFRTDEIEEYESKLPVVSWAPQLTENGTG